MGLIHELVSARELKVYHDFQRRSLLDYSGNGIGLGVGAGSAGYWTKSGGRVGVSGTIATELTAGAQASLDLTVATLFYTFTPMTPSYSPTAMAISKSEGTGTLLNGYTTLVSLTSVWLYLGNPSSFQSILSSGALLNKFGYPVQVAHAWNGTTVWSWVNGVLTDLRPQTAIPTSAGRSYRFGWPGSVGFHDMVLHNGGMVNRVLTGSEVSRLYEEFIDSPKPADLPRRNFVQVPRGLTDSEYAAKGIVLDTAFELVSVSGSRRILDLGPNNYAGTISGVVTPAKDGIGVRIGSVTDNILFPDVTQLNSAASFTYEEVCEFNDVNLPAAGYQAIKFLNVSNYIAMGPIVGAAGATKKHSTVIANGSVTYASTVANVLRKGCKQHIIAVYNGAGATNADKYQVYVDGEAYSCDFPGGNLPSTGPNLAAQALQTGATTGTPRTVESQRWSIPPMTAAQARASYLEFAKKVLLKETFEDVPVSLAAVSAGGYVGQWRVVSGSYKCSETSDGKRWLECVTAGCAILPHSRFTGTTVFILRRASPMVGNVSICIAQNVPTAYNDANANGYAVLVTSAGALGVYRLTGGAAVAYPFYTAAGYLLGATDYKITINRRPSDGRFAMYVKGGSYTAETLVNVAGGAGSNPSASETTYFASSYFGVNMFAGDKLCMYDPRDPSVGLVHYQGQLDPTAGELA